MAALQTIRNRGKILIAAVGLALFAFIIEEGVRSISYFRNESHQRVGEVCGTKINVQEFNQMVDEYADIIKLSNNLSSLNDEQMTQIRDQVWGQYVQQQIVENECAKLGLTVTDAEMQSIINEGRNPMLMQTPFVQNGRFDANQLKQFLAQSSKILGDATISNEVKDQYRQILAMWNYIEKSIRKETLSMKYQRLFAGALVSNPVAAKAAFNARATESEIVMAALPYSTVADSLVAATDKEMKAKYNELKQIFETQSETRNIKYIDILVTPSAADEEALLDEMKGYAQALAEGADPAKTVREAASLVAYSALPLRKEALEHEAAEALDTLSVGGQVGPFFHAHDNSYNIVRLIGKTTLPDSVEVRQIFAPGDDMAASEKTADSIINALNAGADFDTIAKAYNQPAAKNWIVSQQYEGQMIDAASKKIIETVSTATVGAYNKIVLEGQGVIVSQVTDRRNMVEKYDVAVIKRVKEFSKDTYNKAFNDFSSFLAGNTTLEAMQENAAAAGYTVQTRQGMANTEHYVAGVRNTRDAMRWAFNDDTKVGDVSPLYECGDNDHLLCVVLTGINKKGYMPLEDEQVNDYVKSQVLKDKKAVVLTEKMANAKSVEEVAQMDRAVNDTVRRITLASNAYISKTASSEPALSGAVSAAKEGEFKTAVKGNAAVYAFKVLSQKSNGETYDQAQAMKQQAQTVLNNAGNFTSELYKKAKVVDNRYLFY